MKKLIYIMLSLCCFVLYSCGMTEPWKDWENEGNMSEDRLRPSEVKDLLCTTGGWKMAYEGVTFYFQFSEDGAVTSDSDESLLKNAVETDYSLDFEGEKVVLLTLQNGGMLQYLGENQENTFVITGYSDSQIVATGQVNGKTMILNSVTAVELQQAKERKRLAIIAYNKAQAMEILKTDLSNGLLRNASTNQFAAHYAMSCDDDDNWKIKISLLDGKILKHTEYAMTINTTNDEKATLSIDGLTVNGVAVGALYYKYDTGDLSTDNPAFKVDLNKSSDMLKTYTSSWKTHIVDRDNICDHLTGLLTQIEFDDRSPRNIIVCPGETGAGKWHYVGFVINAPANDATGCVYFENTGINYILGSYGDDAGVVRSIPVYSSFLDFCFSDKGVWMYEDSDSYLYVISPVSDEWFRMKI